MYKMRRSGALAAAVDDWLFIGGLGSAFVLRAASSACDSGSQSSFAAATCADLFAELLCRLPTIHDQLTSYLRSTEYLQTRGETSMLKTEMAWRAWRKYCWVCGAEGWGRKGRRICVELVYPKVWNDWICAEMRGNFLMPTVRLQLHDGLGSS